METRLRSIVKATTYRLLATVTTGVLAYLFTEDLSSAFQIGSLDFFIKLLLFYLNDRTWTKITWGIEDEVKIRWKRIQKIRKEVTG